MTGMDRYTVLQEISSSESDQLPGDGSSSSGNKGSEEKQDAEKGQGKKQSTDTVPYHKLFSFADSVDYALMIVGVITAVASGLAQPLMTLVLGKLVNAFGGTVDSKEMTRAVSKVSVDFMYLAVGSLFSYFLEVACWMVTGQRQAARIRRLYLKTILRQDIAFFDTQTSTGEIIGRMSGDTLLIQNAMSEKVGMFIRCLTQFLGGFIVAFIKGWLLTLVLLSSFPPLVMAGATMGILVVKVTNCGQDAYSGAATVVEQTIGSIRTVASFAGEKLAITKYRKSLTKSYRAGVQEGMASGMGLGIVHFVAFSTYSLATWYGGKMVLHKGYTGGDVVNVLMAIVNGSMSLGMASPCMSAFAAGQAAAFKMFEAIERKPLIDAYDTKGMKLDDIRGGIELKDVYFSYPARPDEQIFSGLSLSIPSGAIAALVGQSGSGKSTVISLIERFYDPQSGEVLIDGINLKDFQLKWIRQKIGLVSQEPVLFTSSIRDNIAYGKEGATLEEIEASVELANAANFIYKFPDGLNTMVGEHGTQLSGGQKQRIAIARAILKDPRILLLDEATSALDAESERLVQEALNKIMVNRTTVVVAHRLSTIRNADIIAVMHQGKMVEKGSHRELTENPNGAYSELIRLQQITTAVEEDATGDHHNNLEVRHDSGRHSNQSYSLLQSISSRSSGEENGSHCSAISVPSIISHAEKDPERSKPPCVKPYENIPLHRIASLNKPEIPILILATLAATVYGSILPIFGLLISSMIRTLYEPADELQKGSKFWAIIFLVLALAALVTYPLRSYLFAVVGCRLIRRIRSMCFEKVIHMEVSWFDEVEHSTGAIGARLSADAASIRALAGDAFGFLIQSVTSAIVALVIAFTASWKLSLIVVALIPLIGISGYVHLQVIKGFIAKAKKLFEEATQVASDAVGSIRTVASFCAEDKMLDLYRKKCEGPVNTATKQAVVGGVCFGLSKFLMFSVYALSFYAGARLVQDGKITFSDVFRVFFSLAMGATAISESISLVPDASKAKSSAASIFGILDQKSKIDSSIETGITLEHVKGDIVFDHVSFKYPSRPDIQIFTDLCLDIPFGKTVALVGESGSGKSTVISMLQRFYDPDSGHIRLDGVEIQKLQLKWLRQQMGLVSQEPVLFNDTVRANIAYGKAGNATEAEIIEVAGLANAHKFISGLQNGYDTIVGERGVQLSGGQKQRVAIARAIVKNPKILLLDEATSALDAESEKVVQGALDNVMVGRTTIVVAHRLSTIKDADLIAVVSNGAIAEKGKHETLISMKDGIYASLIALHTSASTN